jgi:hypothetical protein
LSITKKVLRPALRRSSMFFLNYFECMPGL